MADTVIGGVTIPAGSMVLLGVAAVRPVFAPFADPIIFLFIGSFMLAESMFVHGLDRRIAFGALSSRLVGSSPVRILLAFGGVSALISMWISNTATTAMMFPIGLSIVAHLTHGRERETGSREFAVAMMLICAFGASIGGIATPIGTPPNLIGIGMLNRIVGADITFFRWMLLGLPIVALLLGFLIVYFYFRSVRGLDLDTSRTSIIADELRRLGPISRGQRNTLIAFGVTVGLWLFPGVLAILGLGQSAFARAYSAAIPESVAAMTGAVLLFVLPVQWRARQFTLKWEEAVRIDWGIILLFGGGLAMGELAFTTGLAESMGRGITSVLPVHSEAALTILFTAVAIVMSEAASNTASASSSHHAAQLRPSRISGDSSSARASAKVGSLVVSPGSNLRFSNSTMSAGDIEAAVALCSDDVAVQGPRGVGHGHDLVRGWLTRSGIRLEPQEELVGSDGRFVVREVARWTTTNAPDGAPLEPTETWCVFHVGDGKVTSIARFETQADIPPA